MIPENPVTPPHPPLLDDRAWMLRAIGLSRRCPPSDTAFSVGVIVVGADGTELASGYSRESGPAVHAEEAVLAKVAPDDPRLFGATLYSTLEPCSRRASRPVPCARLLAGSGIRRVVIAWREPPLLVENCVGVELLTAAGVTVVELPGLAGAVREINAHLLNKF